MWRYAAPLFLGAFLLFQVQPIVARVILPWFGGTPSVWTTCMLFFQVLLVVGYAYTHLVATRLQPRAQAAVHWGLLAVSVAVLGAMAAAWGAPIVPGPSWKPQGSDFPIGHILLILTVAVGLPYFVLATTSPLMQAWFSRTEPGVSPYRLYALSNVGSLLGLLTYPFLIEPALAQRQQATIWAAGFLLFVLGVAVCAWRVWRANPPVATAEPAVAEDDAPPDVRSRLLWIGLPALAAVLLLAVTNHLCQDVAVTPFLWVVPLSLYLLSFIICFDHERWYWRPFFVPTSIIAVGVALAMLPYPAKMGLRNQILLYSATLFICCMVCHGELVALKPKPRHLTSFYLSVAVGGALGGLLVALLAPVVFKTYLELPIALIVAFVVGVFVPGLKNRAVPLIVAYGRYVLIGGCLSVALLPSFRQLPEKGTKTIAVFRNFYGVLKVEQRSADSAGASNVLLHGRIIHGFQMLAPSERRIPTSYYGPKTGCALAIRNHPRRQAPRLQDRGLRIGVCGLGAGTVAAFAEPGDYLCFYEINPVVPHIARDSGMFTFLSDCRGKTEVVLGDARISLERELAQKGSDQYDLILLDAFSGDAVPAHLLTREAFAMYLQHLRQPNGALAVDVSNAVLDLPPVIWQVAKELGLDCVLVRSTKESSYWYVAHWMILTPHRNYLRDVTIDNAVWQDDGHRKVREWTDDYYNLFQIMK